jgi:hypothetical protein
MIIMMKKYLLQEEKIHLSEEPFFKIHLPYFDTKTDAWRKIPLKNSEKPFLRIVLDFFSSIQNNR